MNALRNSLLLAPAGLGAPLPQYRRIEALEQLLGSPDDPDQPFSFDRALAADEREALPQEALDRLDEQGWHRQLVPVGLGGRFDSCEEFMMLGRALARRDMSAAVSQSTQLWSMVMWIGGDDQQRRALAEEMLAGGVIPCLAYSESGHGADLLANEFEARPGPEGYRLTGRKWPINRAVTSTHAFLLARTATTESQPPERSQSLFLVDKRRVDPERMTDQPKVATYGLRGCDISGIAFDQAWIPGSARIGGEGEGLELALRGLLVTRTFCPGLSLGAGDTMLRVVARYLEQRRLYGGPATSIPHVRETLASTYLSLLIGEGVSLVAARGLHLFPQEASTSSSLAKVRVTRLVDDSARALARLLGARYYMRDADEQGIFQKMLRDSAVVSLFDGSEAVCLDSLAGQLVLIARARRRPRPEDFSALYDLRAPLEPFRPEKVTVFGGGKDAVLASLPRLTDQLTGLAPDLHCDQADLDRLRRGAATVRILLDELFDEVEPAAAERPPAPAPGEQSVKNTPAKLVSLALRLTQLHAGAAALGLWLHNRDHLGDFFAGTDWIGAALDRATGARAELGELTPAGTERVFTRLSRQLADDRYFSLLDLRQASSGARPAEVRASA
jgi:alkylation response protein AidB-like acyl-CoA dehydrogenase